MNHPQTQDDYDQDLALRSQLVANLSQKLIGYLADVGSDDGVMCLESTTTEFLRLNFQRIDRGLVQLKDAVDELLAARDGQ